MTGHVFEIWLCYLFEFRKENGSEIVSSSVKWGW